MLSHNQQKLVKLLDDAVKQAQYGTVTVNVIVKDGEPILESLDLILMRRRKYRMP
jgi:hypothetical protein